MREPCLFLPFPCSASPSSASRPLYILSTINGKAQAEACKFPPSFFPAHSIGIPSHLSDAISPTYAILISNTMAAADVDLGQLSTHLGVPEPALSSLTTEPTVDLVHAVLQAVAAKAREFEVIYSEKLQVDIELENAIRSSEARCEQFKTTTDKSLKEVEEVRQKLRNEGKGACDIICPLRRTFVTYSCPLRK